MISAHFAEVGAYVLNPTERALVMLLDERHGAHVTYATARRWVAEVVGARSWDAVQNFDIKLARAAATQMRADAGLDALARVATREVGVALTPSDLGWIRMRAAPATPPSKPAEFVLPMRTESGNAAGLFVSAIARHEHDCEIEAIHECLGSACDFSREGARFLPNTNAPPANRSFLEWTSKSPWLLGEKRALLHIAPHSLDVAGRRAQLDELLDGWGFVPFIRFDDGEMRLTNGTRRFHAAWNEKAIWIGASGVGAVTLLQGLSEALQTRAMLIGVAWGPRPPDDLEDRRYFRKHGIYLLASSAVGRTPNIASLRAPAVWA